MKEEDELTYGEHCVGKCLSESQKYDVSSVIVSLGKLVSTEGISETTIFVLKSNINVLEKMMDAV